MYKWNSSCPAYAHHLPYSINLYACWWLCYLWANMADKRNLTEWNSVYYSMWTSETSSWKMYSSSTILPNLFKYSNQGHSFSMHHWHNSISMLHFIKHMQHIQNKHGPSNIPPSWVSLKLVLIVLLRWVL